MNKNKKKLIFFGAAGAGKAYSSHTSTLPDYFIDNDETKWGKQLLGVEIVSPKFLSDNLIDKIEKIVVTTGYVKSVLPQLLQLGVPESLIEIPPKSFLGEHPFKKRENRIEAAKLLNQIMRTNTEFKIIAVGGTALGFSRDLDFIEWDFDIDLFASKDHSKDIFNFLDKLKYSPFLENESIKGEIKLSSEDVVPFAIDFFDPHQDIYIDKYEDHTWEWPIEMFLDYSEINIHGHSMNVPNPVEVYLEGIYGKSWNVPNPKFGYNDYGKS